MNILELTEKLQREFEAYELCRLQASQVAGLADKLRKDDVTLAVIGQFKRGKTSMVNSILGEKLLPVGIVPITSAVTRIEHGPSSSKVYFLNGLAEDVKPEDLHEYISEQENHDNERGVAEVEMHTEAEFLEDGLILVDTPGVGSVHENNSKSAYDFARESDGVIFMLSVDSPVNQIEIDFLKSVRKFAGKFYFAVNKIDIISDDELKEYLEYCTALITDILDMPAEEVRLMPISAKKGIGLEELKAVIRQDLLTKAPEIMKNSVRLKLLEIIRNTRTQISSYREVLKMAPNVFNSRFREMNEMLDEQREADSKLEEGRYLRARLNEQKAFLTGKIRELFGIEYFYYVDRQDAAEMLTRDEYVEEISETYDELAETLNAIFMYKEENAYTVARRIEDLNILIHDLDKFKRILEKQ